VRLAGRRKNMDADRAENNVQENMERLFNYKLGLKEGETMYDAEFPLKKIAIWLGVMVLVVLAIVYSDIAIKFFWEVLAVWQQ